MVDIANDVATMCPEAVFINYSNPLSAICRAVRKATPAKMVGLCIGVKDVHDNLSRAMGVPPEEAWSTAIGINHFTWFIELRHKGQDAWPLLREKLAEKLGPEGQNLCWDLFRAYGAFPAVGDNHVVEFMPGDWQKKGGYFGKTLGLDGANNFEVNIIEHDERVFQRMKDKAYGRLPIDADDEIGEYSQLVEILRSIWYDEPRYYSVNLPNAGQAGNLPMGAVLEATTLVNGSGFHPFSFGELPVGVTAHLLRVIGVIELTVDAALKADRQLFVQALIADGTVFTLKQAEALADALLEAQKEWLPNYFS